MTVKEEIERFIRKRAKQEREKMMSGEPNNCCAWSLYEDDFKDNKEDLEYLRAEFVLAKKFLKERSLEKEYEMWKEKQ